MKTVFKYKLKLYGETSLELPIDANILTAGIQLPNNLVIWVEVNPLQTYTEERKFISVYTGDSIYHKNLNYINTVIDFYDTVYHVYEILEW